MAELDQKTLEQLLDDRFEKQAVMIKAGFDNTATKENLKGVEKSIRSDISKIVEIDLAELEKF